MDRRFLTERLALAESHMRAMVGEGSYPEMVQELAGAVSALRDCVEAMAEQRDERPTLPLDPKEWDLQWNVDVARIFPPNGDGWLLVSTHAAEDDCVGCLWARKREGGAQ